MSTQINEPDRPIPSGRVSVPAALRWYFAISLDRLCRWLVGSLTLGLMGMPVATVDRPRACLGLQCATVSTEAERLVGQFGAVGLCYERPAVVYRCGGHDQAPCPPGETIILALLYSIGAHGIMTLNDFKSIEGDTDHRSSGRCRYSWVQNGAARVLPASSWLLPQLVVVDIAGQHGATTAVRRELSVSGLACLRRLALMRRFLE